MNAHVHDDISLILSDWQRDALAPIRFDPTRAIKGQIAWLVTKHNNPHSLMEAAAVAAARDGRAAYWSSANYHDQTARLFCWQANEDSIAPALASSIDASHPGKMASVLLASLIPLNTFAEIELRDAKERAYWEEA